MEAAVGRQDNHRVLMRTGENCSQNSAVLRLCTLWTCIRATARVRVESQELRVRQAPSIPSPQEDGLRSPPRWNQAAFERLHYQRAAAGHRQKGIIIQGKPPATYEAQCSGTKSSGKLEHKQRYSISITACLIPPSATNSRILTQTQS